ncbi:MAG: cell wall hydrolase [Clostridiales bacterium]|nr:cell wall hydrolase [Clostridiales bacterium]
MKKIICIVLLLILMTTISFGDETLGDNDELVVETSVMINESYLYSDTQHILVEDTVFVVGRYLVEALGGSIEWTEATQTVKMTLEEHVIEIVIGSTEATVDGTEIQLYKAPFIKDGRTMIPLKFVSEHFGCEVSWIQSTYTVDIIKDGLVIPEELTYNRTYSDEDLYLLSKIVTVESGDKSLEMALAIANTVLNRVKDSRFPDTVSGVIYQVDVYKQFPPAHKSSFETLEPTQLSIIASKKALEGINNIGNSLFFNNQPFKSKTDDLIRIIDGEYFYN